MSKTVFADVILDVCTQRDYLSPNGARPSANLTNLRHHLKELMAFARWIKLPTVSTVEVHRPDEHRVGRPPACVIGTEGQRKVSFTLLPNRKVVDNDNSLSVALDLFERYQQVIFFKPERDPFSNPKLDRFLTELPVKRFVLVGMALDDTIRHLALGLLMRHREVTVVYDACGYWDRNVAEMNLRHLSAKEVTLVSTRNFLKQRMRKLASRGLNLRPSRGVA